MSTEQSRLYNFVDDKNNGIPITSSRVDAELNQDITALNQKVIIKATAPTSPINLMIWVDSTLKLVKQYRNGEWVVMGVVHIGSAAPVTVQKGDLWYDTVNNILNGYNGTTWDTYATIGVNAFTGTQKWAKGADIASATTVTLGEDGNFFDITGTTTITSITIKAAGTIVCLQFDGILTLTDGSNLKLAGNLVTAAETTIELISDGTNWFEISRSPANAQTSGLLGAPVAKVNSTIYQAATDGFLYGSTHTDDGAYYEIRSDSSATPTTVRMKVGGAGSTTTDHYGAFCCPIRKNDFYRIIAQGSGDFQSLDYCFFTPLGS